MANHLFIIPGYSDEDFSFLPLKNLLVKEDLYAEENIKSIEYASLDDQADFRDFADRLDDIYEDLLRKGEIDQRIDVLAHSTGSLVVRAWLYLRRMRQNVRKQTLDMPVEHLFLFAPANFGSDLAKIGQSPLNALKVTFTKLKKKSTLIGNQDAFETGKKVLQGLEPASPSQWELSSKDLHNERYSYFGENPGNIDDVSLTCFPFIFSAGNYSQSFASIIVRELQKDGTDSTVRIAGTSLNTRKCKLRSLDNKVEWQSEKKFENIAFAIFGGYDHCGIINDNGKCKIPDDISEEEWIATKPSLPDSWEPLELLKEAKQVSSVSSYKELAKGFQNKTDQYSSSPLRGIYQQFFFKIIDDTGLEVTDYFIRFLVYDLHVSQEEEDKDLTKEFRKKFGSGTEFYIHSVNPAYRVLMLDIKSVQKFIENDLSDNKQIKLEVIAKSPYFGVSLQTMKFTIYDSRFQNEPQPSFFYPHTTTLVEIVLDRKVHPVILNPGGFTQGSG
jgi:hypothetical protein